MPSLLLDDLGDAAGADGAAAFADGEAEAFVHGDRVDELDRPGHQFVRVAQVRIQSDLAGLHPLDVADLAEELLLAEAERLPLGLLCRADLGNTLIEAGNGDPAVIIVEVRQGVGVSDKGDQTITVASDGSDTNAVSTLSRRSTRSTSAAAPRG